MNANQNTRFKVRQDIEKENSDIGVLKRLVGIVDKKNVVFI